MSSFERLSVINAFHTQRFRESANRLDRFNLDSVGEVISYHRRATAELCSRRRVSQFWVRCVHLSVFAFICVLGPFTSAQTSLDPFTGTTDSATYVENDASVLSTLATLIQGRINTTEQEHYNFKLDSRGESRLDADFSNLSNVTLTAKHGVVGLDYEAGSPFVFSVIGTKKTTARSELRDGQLTLTITITPVDEKPVVTAGYTGATGRIFYIQRNPNYGIDPQIPISDIFRDPERQAMTFKACADDFRINEFDTANSAYTTSAEHPNPRGSFEADAHVSGAATGTIRNCPTPITDTNIYDATKDVTRNGQVVNVTTFGPAIRILPVTATGVGAAGVRRAEITFRGWVGTPQNDDGGGTVDENVAISPLATITVYVKTGANNGPSFPGGAQGFAVQVRESVVKDAEVHIGPPTGSTGAWNASDLDGDTLTYRLEGTPASSDCQPSAVDSAVALGNGCAWINTSSNNVEVKGKNIDFETAPPNKTYTINLVASDGYNPAQDIRVPISVTVLNVDEGLVFSGQINQIKQLVVGRSGRSVDLNDHFMDPDGTPITYSVNSSNPSVVGASLQGSILTVNAVGTAGSSSLFITATSGGLSIFESILVSVRETNQAPTFAGGIATVQAQREVVENEPVGALIRVPGLRYSDPDGDSITASVVNATPFEAVVDPEIDSQKRIGEIALRLTGSIDYETNQRYVVEVQLNDGWDLSARTVNVIVEVLNVNEPPRIATDALGNPRSIPDQTVSVGSTRSITVSEYFTDPEGGRLLFDATVESGSQFVSATVVGVSTVQFEGLQATGSTPAVVRVTATDSVNPPVSLTFRVNVSSNNPPQLVRQPVVPALRVGTATTIQLTGTFSDPDTGDSIQRYEASSNDESVVLAQVSGDGLSMVLIPRAEGSTTVVITAIDTRGGRGQTTVPVTVLGNVPPVISTPINTVELRPNATAPAIDLTTHFSDPDGDTLTFTAATDQPNIATATVEGNNLTIRARDRGLTSVRVTATDPDGESVQMTFLVAVVNDPPTAQTSISLDLAHRGDSDSVDLTTIFTDPDNDALTFEASVTDDTIATASIQGSTLTVEAMGVGETQITVTATDAFGLAGMSTFAVTIANQAPVVAMEIEDQQTDRTMMIMVDLSMVFSDPDGDPLTYTASVTGSQIATATINGSTLEVTTSDIGTTTIEVTATDEFGDSVSTDFDVEVRNLAPTIDSTAIASFDLQIGGEAESRDIAGALSDDDDTPLVIAATTVNELVATVSVSGTTITVTPVSRGGTMVEATATDTHGASSESVLVSVRVSDSEIKAVANTALASFARTVLSSVTSTLGARLIADADGLYTPFAMYSLDDFAPTDSYVTASNKMTESSRFGIDNDGWATNPLHVGTSTHQNQYNQLESLFGRGFALKLAAAGDPTFWSLWGGLDSQSFEAADHEGSATSFYFGADATLQGQWTFGIGIGRTTGDVDYTYGNATQKMENDLTQVLPYARFQPSDRTTIYGAFGVGSGTLETTIVGVESNDRSDLKSTLGLFGGRQVMYTAANGLNLAIVGDVGMSNLETDEGDNGADSLLAEVSRIRGGLETSFNMLMGADGSFTPFLTVGFRTDSGDGIADSGVEVSGGIRITNPILTLDANFRTLATYGEDDYSETGFAIMALLNPTAGATGLSISLSPSWGASTVHTNALWQDDLQVNRVPDLASWGIAHNEQVRIDSNIGYGFLVIDERFLLTPFIDVQSGYSNEHDVSIGAKFTQMLRSAQNLDVSVQVGETSSYSGTQEESIKFNARLNF